MARKPKSDDAPAGAERPKLTLRIVFDSQSRMFGYYDPTDETHCESYSWPTAHEATDSALQYADEMCADDGGSDGVDLVIEGGDWGIKTKANVRIVEDQGLRRWFNGHLYEMDLDELTKAVTDEIADAKEQQEVLTARCEIPIGQCVDAARKLHQQLYGKRKRGSNAPALNAFLNEMFDGMDRRTRDRNHNAFLHIASDEWPEMDAQYKGTRTGLERIFAAAKEFHAANKPTVVKPKRTPLKRRYNDLLEAALDNDAKRSRDLANQFTQEDAKPDTE